MASVVCVPPRRCAMGIGCVVVVGRSTREFSSLYRHNYILPQLTTVREAYPEKSANVSVVATRRRLWGFPPFERRACASCRRTSSKAALLAEARARGLTGRACDCRNWHGRCSRDQPRRRMGQHGAALGRCRGGGCEVFRAPPSLGRQLVHTRACAHPPRTRWLRRRGAPPAWPAPARAGGRARCGRACRAVRRLASPRPPLPAGGPRPPLHGYLTVWRCATMPGRRVSVWK